MSIETKTIQTKVLLGQGEKTFFQEVTFDFGMDGIFMVEHVDEWVEVTEAFTTKGNSIMFNAYIYKNIAYKKADCAFVDCYGNATVVGPVCHMTKRIQFGGCIELTVDENERICEKDIAEILEAKIVGSHDDLLEPCDIMPMMPLEIQEKTPNPGAMPIPCIPSIYPPLKKYHKLQEKMCIKISAKAVRWEHLEVQVEEN